MQSKWGKYAGASLAVAFTMLVSACGTEDEGNPQPEQTDSSDAATSQTNAPIEDQLAPTVANPKNVDGINPCNFLTPEQAEGFNLPTTGEPLTGALGGDQCQWTDSATGLNVIIYLENSGSNLSDVYAQEGDFEFFEPGEAGGHPVVSANRAASDLSCETYTAINDDEIVVVSSHLREANDGTSCEWGLQIAEAVLENF
ncbi:DUF3558 domain-containing protein [Actinoalloteichus hymeniacidonis]|uniref:DUF3558 domain-containing protein n=1 Tax=Actinoalloteichus hymeniacidonis TaxID=340345 RepID=UPI000A03B058|nr:DUF3558 domain-containing protein [Actinoalloteichus hymeniacidonis]MBB5911056.1 hypothetical protein [Actinoalloteichus hymeniacidonis]